MRQLLLIILLLLQTALLVAQEDSIHIEINAIDITGSPQEAVYAVGSRLSSIKPSIIESTKSLSLSELLTENSSIYIKSYGQGALSTSSFRGTSSAHTGVNWNGININPSMSGSFDFSKIPVFFVDDIMLRHGSGGTSSGSGALGGSIYINNEPLWGDSSRVKAFVEVGSFSTYSAAASASIETKKSWHRTRLFYTWSKNDFRFLNKVFSVEPFYENRTNSNYQSGAIMQEDYFRLGGGTLSSNCWVTIGERALPQPITLAPTTSEDESTTSLKYSLRYDKRYGRHYYNITGGYLYDNMFYTKEYVNAPEVIQNRNISHRATIKGQYQYDLKENLLLGGSASYTYDRANAESYSNGGISRSTLLFSGYALYKPSKYLDIAAEASLDITESNPGGLFSIGAKQSLYKDIVTLGGSISYNRKYPTLNDLYWVPGGNPDLVPERGISYDATLGFKKKFGTTTLKVDATYYIMNIRNWIVWMPTSSYFWSPKNMKRVVSQGVELMAELNFKTAEFSHRLSTNYTYSSSQNRESGFKGDASVGKQLPYIPFHKVNARYSVNWRGANFAYSIYYNSERYTTTDNSYKTDGYIINDLEASYRIETKGRFVITPRLRVNNLFNEYYESIQYYPMPLRSFSLGATLSF